MAQILWHCHFEKAKEIRKARLVKMPSGVVTSAFSFNVYRGKRGGRSSTGEPRDRFGHIGWCPLLFFFLQLLFLKHT